MPPLIFELEPGDREDWLNLDGIQATGNISLDNALSADGTPEVGKRYTLPARTGRAVRVQKGQTVRVINTHGTQVVDTWAFNADDLREFMSMEHARAWINHMTPKVGDQIVTNKRRAILTMVEDTSPGVHDTFIAACDIDRFRTLGVKQYHDNCTDNMHMGMLAIGLRAPEVPSPFNLWMNIPVRPDGSIGWLPTVSKPGDVVSFKAEMDLIFVMSACPQDIVPINGEGCSPVEAHFEVTA